MWIVRNNGIAPWLYWGFQQLGNDEIADTLGRSRAVLFLAEWPTVKRGGERHAEERALENIQASFPGANKEQMHQVGFLCHSVPLNSTT